METISGTHTVAITLSTGAPNVLVHGTIDAYGPFGTYAGQTIYGAVFGPVGTDFTLQIKGIVESAATSANGAGIVFGGPGDVKNSGTILGANGVLIFGGGTVQNSELVAGTIADGISLQGAGTVLNTGIVTGAAAGVVVSGGGYVQNYGNISGGTGIAVAGAAGSYVYNTGRVIAGAGDGVTLAAAGSVSNAGSIVAGGVGIVLGSGGIVYNYGFLSGGAAGVSLAAGGKVFNTTSLAGGAAGIAASAGYAAIYNYAAGRITGTYGVSLGAVGYVYNSGSITGTIGAVAMAGGALINDGELTGRTFGVAAGTAPATVTNAGTILATANSSAHAAAVSFGDGGILLNETNGRILGAVGVSASGEPLSIVNDGYIAGYRSDAVLLRAGGMLINSGSIGHVKYTTGFNGGVQADGLATVENTGLIVGATSRDAIDLTAGGLILNTGSIFGYIQINSGGTLNNAGYMYSLVKITGPALVMNTGTIQREITLTGTGTVTNDGVMDGVTLNAFGRVINAGDIDYGGVTLKAGGTLENTGTLRGYYGGNLSEYGPGVYLTHGGFVTNSGYMRGLAEGVSLANGGTLINSGLIRGIGSREGQYFGVGLSANGGATIINDGTIYGVSGVFLGAGGTLMNAGTIYTREQGSGPAVSFKSSAQNRLVDLPGAVFGGQVELGGGALELAAAALTGTAALAATAISGLTAITIDHGAAWEILDGTVLSTAVSVLNDGTLLQQAAPALALNGPLTGDGTIDLGTAGLTLNGSVAATQNIDFSGSAESLYLGNVASFDAPIYGFAPGDTIELAGILKTKGNGLKFSHGVLTIDNAGSPVELTFGNAATFGSEKFQEFKDGYGVGITLSGGAMAFLAPAQAPAKTLPITRPAYAAANTAGSPAAIPTITAGLWAPHWIENGPSPLPPLTLQN